MSHPTQSPRRIVAKYGGASLADQERIMMATEAVAREIGKGNQVAVVVSAIGNTTDSLLTLADGSTNGAIDKVLLDDLLSMGERTSVRLFNAALKSRGVMTCYFDPSDKEWPIITDGTYLDANPILEQCDDRIRRFVLPLIEKGITPIIPGFVGKMVDGQISTLGRGGSDTTAFVLARGLNANEVVLVTDSDGIMSADPKIIGNGKRLAEIDVGTLMQLTDSGKKFIHRKALRYKNPLTNVRVINYRHGDLSSEGTEITGAVSEESDFTVSGPLDAASITIAGQCLSEETSLIRELAMAVKAYSVLLGLAADRTSIVLYALKNDCLQTLLKDIHEVILRQDEALGMSVKTDLAYIETSGIFQEDFPAVMSKILEALSMKKTSTVSLFTIASRIAIFVAQNESEKILTLMRESLRR